MKNKIFVASLIGAGLLLADETKSPTSSESKNLTSQFLDGIEAKGFAKSTLYDNRWCWGKWCRATAKNEA